MSSPHQQCRSPNPPPHVSSALLPPRIALVEGIGAYVSIVFGQEERLTMTNTEVSDCMLENPGVASSSEVAASLGLHFFFVK